MKTFHEAPISIFNEVQQLTDGDYALVHLFEENDEYYNLFVDALKKGRTVILDNSIFELGSAFDTEKYIEWINKLKPTYYIIPDVLEDKDGTLKNINDWDFSCYGKSIGVVQGRTYNEVVECYKQMVDKVDKVAFTLRFGKLNDGNYTDAENMMTRVMLIQRMVRDGHIREDKQHHILGCYLPQEFAFYRNYKWIDSVDTSNPVVAGLNYILYDINGLDEKPPQKLFTLIDVDVTDEQLNNIKFNINKFKKMIS